MFALLNFAFQNASTLRLVKSCDFEYLRRVEPGIGASSHYRDPLAHPPRVMLANTVPKARRFGAYIS